MLILSISVGMVKFFVYSNSLKQISKIHINASAFPAATVAWPLVSKNYLTY